MVLTAHSITRPLQTSARTMATSHRRYLTAVAATKKEGDISSVFASLSGNTPPPLSPKFADVKRKLIQGREEAVAASWKRLLKGLEQEIKIVERRGSSIIPSIKYDDLQQNFPKFEKDLKERGAGVVRSVVPQDIARAYKDDLEEYIKANPSTKGKYKLSL
jgi:hypothetical protein